MSNSLNIGNEAKTLDQKSLKERMKIKKRTWHKILLAILVYFLIMVLFYFFI